MKLAIGVWACAEFVLDRPESEILWQKHMHNAWWASISATQSLTQPLHKQPITADTCNTSQWKGIKHQDTGVMANSEIAPLALPMSQPLDLPGHPVRHVYIKGSGVPRASRPGPVVYNGSDTTPLLRDRSARERGARRVWSWISMITSFDLATGDMHTIIVSAKPIHLHVTAKINVIFPPK